MTETSTLTLHRGGWKSNLDEIASVPLPERTWSYTPVPHMQIVDTLKNLLDPRKIVIKKEAYALASEGNRMFGVLDVTENSEQPDWGFALGFRNSYDKSMSFALLGGHRVWICDNLAFSGEIQISRKHSGTIDRDLKSMIGGLLDSFSAGQQDITEFIDFMKTQEINDKQAHDFICRSLRDGVIPTSHASKVLDQWYEPAHEDFAPRTKWSLFNAFTEVAKDRSAGLQMTSTTGLTTLMKHWDETA